MLNRGSEYRFLFITKGGGSANKTFLYQESKALLNPESLLNFVAKNLHSLGTSACPPYHLAFVVGGMSAEFTLKTVKLASCHYLDDLPTTGTNTAAPSEMSSWKKKFLRCARKPALGRNSAANILPMTSASFACHVTAPRVLWASASRAQPIVRS